MESKKTAEGTATWQDQLIAAAVEDKVQVVFTDPKLQQRLRDARQAVQDQAKPKKLDFTRAKERFQYFDEQLMKQYGYGLDSAKADRLIAGAWPWQDRRKRRSPVRCENSSARAGSGTDSWRGVFEGSGRDSYPPEPQTPDWRRVSI